ncbi:MAG: sel1 repeat family protein, partial [Butyrivibrio sp.]|nr:sel1 repeat family protein [Butyrivibrio sp.]
WYQKSAEQGLARGQNNLGYMYEHGQGVVQDYIKAVEWYQKSAERGNSIAQNNHYQQLSDQRLDRLL